MSGLEAFRHPNKKVLATLLLVLVGGAILGYCVYDVVQERTACEAKHCKQPGFEPRYTRNYECLCVEIPK
jgi:hypothetical protein